MKWFGVTWGAPVCTAEDQVEAPLGDDCVFCKRAFIAESRGFILSEAPRKAAHVRCFMSACSPSPEIARHMQVAQQIVLRAAQLVKPPDQVVDVLEHVRANHVQAMREVKVTRPAAKSRLALTGIEGASMKPQEQPIVSEARATAIAKACIVEGPKGVGFQILAEKLLETIAAELGKNAVS